MTTSTTTTTPATKPFPARSNPSNVVVRVRSLDICRAHTAGEWKSAKDLGWWLLDKATDRQIGERRAFSAFETALDWRLGLVALELMKACRAQTGKPVHTFVEIARNGDVLSRGQKIA